VALLGNTVLHALQLYTTVCVIEGPISVIYFCHYWDSKHFSNVHERIPFSHVSSDLQLELEHGDVDSSPYLKKALKYKNSSRNNCLQQHRIRGKTNYQLAVLEIFGLAMRQIIWLKANKSCTRAHNEELSLNHKVLKMS